MTAAPGMLEKGLNAQRWINEVYRLQSELESYKIALKYFTDTGGQPAKDIARNLLKELEDKK